MILSSALKWSIALVLVPTMAWKTVLQPENLGETHEAVVKFLNGQKFDVRMTDESIENMPVIEAKNETCHFSRAAIFYGPAHLFRAVKNRSLALALSTLN